MCDAVSPEGVKCQSRAMPSEHRDHVGRQTDPAIPVSQRQIVHWPNPDYVEPVAETKVKDKFIEIAGKATGRPALTPIGDEPGPIVGNEDPSNSHVAAEQVEPTRGTKRAQVLDALRAASGNWVDAPDLATQEVGGFGGTRRMRELRDMGWPIETRQKPGAPNTWQHRLPVATALRHFD